MTAAPRAPQPNMSWCIDDNILHPILADIAHQAYTQGLHIYIHSPGLDRDNLHTQNSASFMIIADEQDNTAIDVTVDDNTLIVQAPVRCLKNHGRHVPITDIDIDPDNTQNHIDETLDQLRVSPPHPDRPERHLLNVGLATYTEHIYDDLVPLNEERTIAPHDTFQW